LLLVKSMILCIFEYDFGDVSDSYQISLIGCWAGFLSNDKWWFVIALYAIMGYGYFIAIFIQIGMDEYHDKA